MSDDVIRKLNYIEIMNAIGHVFNERWDITTMKSLSNISKEQMKLFLKAQDMWLNRKQIDVKEKPTKMARRALKFYVSYLPDVNDAENTIRYAQMGFIDMLDNIVNSIERDEPTYYGMEHYIKGLKYQNNIKSLELLTYEKINNIGGRGLTTLGDINISYLIFYKWGSSNKLW